MYIYSLLFKEMMWLKQGEALWYVCIRNRFSYSYHKINLYAVLFKKGTIQVVDFFLRVFDFHFSAFFHFYFILIVPSRVKKTFSFLSSGIDRKYYEPIRGKLFSFRYSKPVWRIPSFWGKSHFPVNIAFVCIFWKVVNVNFIKYLIACSYALKLRFYINVTWNACLFESGINLSWLLFV